MDKFVIGNRFMHNDTIYIKINFTMICIKDNIKHKKW